MMALQSGPVLLFAGQGSQAVGMAADCRRCPDCAAVLATADTALGWPLSRVMHEGPAAALRRTAIAQPALLTVAVAQGRHLVARGLRPAAFAGHSLGQYAALVLAESLDFADAVRLVAERGRLMQAVVPEGEGAMIAVLGLERDAVVAACAAEAARGVVGIACHNAPSQTVVSGAAAAVAAVAARCEADGAGVVDLAVSAPFHSAMLTPMLPAFAARVAELPVARPVRPVWDNVTAAPLTGAAAVRRALVQQICSPVLFEESLRAAVAAGAQHFIQCGPGDSLLRMARRIARGARLETFAEASARLAGAESTEVAA